MKSIAREHHDLRLVAGRLFFHGIPALREIDAYLEWTGEAPPPYAGRDYRRPDDYRTPYAYHVTRWLREAAKIGVPEDLRAFTGEDLLVSKLAICAALRRAHEHEGEAIDGVGDDWPAGFAPLAPTRERPASMPRVRTWRDAMREIEGAA